VVCLVWSGESSIYRRERVLRGSEELDHGAAIPASYGARRWRRTVLRFLAERLAATARSGGVGLGCIASMSAAAMAGSLLRLRRRRSRVRVERVSGASAVAR
jgi:hypothetical protein